MKLPEVALPSLPALAVPRLGLAAFRRRLVLRAVFLALATAPLLLAGVLLGDEKQRLHERYEQGFRGTLSELTARLRQGPGQLALLNPGYTLAQAQQAAPLRLPFGALDFDDRHKAAQAVELAACAMRYADGATLCSAVGGNPYAGGFVYLVAQFDAQPLRARERGQLELADVHRVHLRLAYRGQVTQWLAPLEGDAGKPATRRGTLAGFALVGEGTEAPQDLLPTLARPERDFRGWMWQEGECVQPAAPTNGGESADCVRRTQLSLRVPVAAFQALLREAPAGQRPAWPPADLAAVRVALKVQGPGGAQPFDSTRPLAAGPFMLEELVTRLAPGEMLRIHAVVPGGEQLVLVREGRSPGPLATEPASAPWLLTLVRWLPVGGLPGQAAPPPQVSAEEWVNTPQGRYRVALQGSAASQDPALAATATRLSWFVLAMSGAVLLAWAIVELGLIRGIARLTRRAAEVSVNMNDPQLDRRLGELDVSDLRGRDELGILAGGLADLLHKVKEGARREHIRAEQEREQWHAVGHEIMSPLQSLLVLHGDETDPSRRYVLRMQQAVRVLYGTASPSEAIASASVSAGRLDADAFLQHVAANAAYAGVEQVQYTPRGGPLWCQADEYALEDAITHLLRNAQRHRTPGTAVQLSLNQADEGVVIGVRNQGVQIEPAMLGRIFEYGVSGSAEAPAASAGAAPEASRRGQGLFVARTYLAKMGGTLHARNLDDGVCFELTLLRA